MSVVVAVPDSPEGRVALAAGVTEAALLGTDLVAVNLALTALDVSTVPEGTPLTVVERRGPEDRDPVAAVLDEVEQREVQRLVIGLKKRSPVGKAVLGSVSQQLLLRSPVPVLAVKLP